MTHQFEKLKIEDSKQYHEVLFHLCKSILRMDPKITFVAVLNEKGRIEEIQTTGSILDSFPSHKREAFFMEYSLLDHMRKEYDEDFGQVGYTCDQRERRVLFSFPMMNFLVVTGCKIGVTPTLLAGKIMGLIKDSCVTLKSTVELNN
jgi:hypothetical protein